MSEPIQQLSGRNKALGYLVGMVGGGLAFFCVLDVVALALFGDLNRDGSDLLFFVGFAALGLSLVVYGGRLSRRQ